jgi:mRNA interferase MazF
MKRGDIITVAVSGDYGKPRPAVVIQADWPEDSDSVLCCLMTTLDRDAPLYRLTVPATVETGLQQVSWIMVEKVFAVRRAKCGAVIGRLPAGSTLALNVMLGAVIGLSA